MLSEAMSRLHKSGIQATGAVLCQTDIHRMTNYVSYYDTSYDKYYGYNAGQDTLPPNHIGGQKTNIASDQDAQLYPAQVQSKQRAIDRDGRPVIQKVSRKGKDRNRGSDAAWIHYWRRSREATKPNAKTK
jgi:hypothetical protein